MTAEKSKVGKLDARMQGFVDSARQDLASRLKATGDQIELVEAKYVTWRDSSLGCPQPGTQYLQVLINGTRIKLRHAGKNYHYHGGEGKAPKLCNKPAINAPLPPGSGDS